jgi:hypothetical protein
VAKGQAQACAAPLFLLLYHPSFPLRRGDFFSKEYDDFSEFVDSSIFPSISPPFIRGHRQLKAKPTEKTTAGL